jgi:large subunit ribosomal protein L6
MSRIGKNPIEISSDVKVSIDGDVITFKNSKNSMELDTKGHVEIALEGNLLTFKNKSDSREDRAFWGTYRSLAANIVTGLTSGYAKQLEINGVGYRAEVQGKVLKMQLGFSHDVLFDIPEGIEITVEKNVVTIKGYDKQKLGQVCADIRAYRPPEPYKGKGIKYVDEHIVRKAGKTAKK